MILSQLLLPEFVKASVFLLNFFFVLLASPATAKVWPRSVWELRRTYQSVSRLIWGREAEKWGTDHQHSFQVYLKLCVCVCERVWDRRYRSAALIWDWVWAEVERFAQFVSQLLLSALTEVMPDTVVRLPLLLLLLPVLHMHRCVCACVNVRVSIGLFEFILKIYWYYNNWRCNALFFQTDANYW